ncbi:TetR/AcrR family transcriptional regulator [Clostridium sp. YIM B02515]|uniref:TetR/AcrR family transcriptional regulator n=1 Tax=Clostridium rhizosphaerae TaxID=2803861 RepID=A0ABS1TJ62_9CLOT|nr:TetR/AcrR family transcriptional regulator [Clostridium rhizosphaerae]
MARGDREEEIIEAAVKIFSEKGFSAATTSEIAKEAGIAEGTIFRYFKTKKDILRKVMIKLVEVMGERIMTRRLAQIFEVNKDKDEKEVLKILLKDRFDVAVKYWDMIKVVMTEVQYHEDLKEALIKNIIIKGKSIVELFFQQGIEKGRFRNIDTNIVIRSLIGMMGLYVIQKQIMPDLVTVEEDKQLDIMIDLFLNGLYKREEVL